MFLGTELFLSSENRPPRVLQTDFSRGKYRFLKLRLHRSGIWKYEIPALPPVAEKHYLEYYNVLQCRPSTHPEADRAMCKGTFSFIYVYLDSTSH